MIKAKPVISSRIFLSDLLGGDYPDTLKGKALRKISDSVAELESDDEERAWVTVRQATEADSMRRAGRVSKRTVRWSGSDVEEMRDDNLREQWALEVYMCLTDAGNIVDHSNKPLFQFKEAGLGYPKLAMGFQDFLKAYGGLPSPVTLAMRRAVLELNPDWDYWFTEDDESGEE